MRYTVKSGFSLVELILVVLLISILAIGIIAALGGLEQLNRARDAQTYAVMVEMNKAIQSYLFTAKRPPWCNKLPDGDNNADCEFLGPIGYDWGTTIGVDQPPRQKLYPDNPDDDWSDSLGNPAFNNIVSTGDIRTNYRDNQKEALNRIFIRSHFVYWEDLNGEVSPRIYSLCFQPQSDLWQKRTETKYTALGNNSSMCRSNGTGGTYKCFQCFISEPLDHPLL